MEEELFTKENISTIAVLIYGACSAFLAQYLTQEQFSAIFIAAINIILILYSAKNPNTLKVFGNASEEKIETEEDLVNEEYC